MGKGGGRGRVGTVYAMAPPPADKVNRSLKPGETWAWNRRRRWSRTVEGDRKTFSIFEERNRSGMIGVVCLRHP